MKRINHALGIIIFAYFINLPIAAQEYEVPKNYTLVEKEDYKPYENEILMCINYLEMSLLNSEIEKRKEANAFLLKWITGCPYINMELHSYTLDLYKKILTFFSYF